MRTGILLVISSSCIAFAATRAQSGYYNLDAGRPGRIEDALPTPRDELELQLAPARFERVGGGVRRVRLEPRLAYGVAPLTEVEFRVPFVMSSSPDPETPLRMGLGGLGVGVMRALGVEQGQWPGVAVAAEWIAPVGSLSAHTGSYSAKVLATKTLPFARGSHECAVWHIQRARVRLLVAQSHQRCSTARLHRDSASIRSTVRCESCDGHRPAVGAPRNSVFVAAVSRLETPEFDPTRSMGMWMTMSRDMSLGDMGGPIPSAVRH